MKSRPQFWSLRRPAVWALALFLLLGTLNAGVAQEQSGLTFSEDIAPILYENCVGCHQPNGIGPMPLLSYDDVRPYVSRIKRKVEAREIPPGTWTRPSGFRSTRTISPSPISRSGRS